MQYVKDVDDARFQEEVVLRSHEVPVVVDFWAAWCGPCRVLSPLLERLTEEHGGAFELAKIDVDRNPELAARFGVQGIPTVVAFRDGEAVTRFTGALPEHQLRSWLGEVLPSEADRLVDRARDALLDGDPDTAERLQREALDGDPRHQDAGTGLASLLLSQGRPEEAMGVLGALDPTQEVQRLQAAARLALTERSDLPALEARLQADPHDEEARLSLARALAANREYEPALDHLLELVRARGATKEEARQAMLDIFEVLGSEHPLTGPYRRRLASTLF